MTEIEMIAKIRRSIEVAKDALDMGLLEIYRLTKEIAEKENNKP